MCVNDIEYCVILMCAVLCVVSGVMYKCIMRANCGFIYVYIFELCIDVGCCVWCICIFDLYVYNS